jgi:DNA (cytosine-5)-methyltransferase 1
MENRQKLFDMADLFCGAGGTSNGLLDAAEELGLNVHLVAINHWDVAIATHQSNHPEVTHINDDLEKIDPLVTVPSGKLRLLVASPECTHFSNAAGGMPKNKQSRASVKYVLRWIGKLDIETVLIENVPEFQGWGPLHRTCNCEAGIDAPVKKHTKKCHLNKPIHSRRGEYFRHLIQKIRSYGYNVEWRVLNAADYGDATTRKRLFIFAFKNRPVIWPAPTHSPTGRNLAGNYEPWRPARDVIDWSVKGKSIFKRKKPLSRNTLKRIEAGLRKYSGSPFVLGQQTSAAPRTTEQPLPTIATAGAISFVQPFLIQYHGSSYEGGERTASVDKPVPTIDTRNRFGLVEPFVMNIDHSAAQGLLSRPVSQPMQTILSEESLALVEPYIVPVNHGPDERTYSVDKPMPTITSFDALALAEPFIVQLNGTREEQLLTTHFKTDKPLPTITGSGHIGLVEPYLIEYYGTGLASSINAPLPTQTGKDRFALVEPFIFSGPDGKVYMLDILFRMLKPTVLAAAMSFPENYKFTGIREDIVKQIGNAVPRRLAKALCLAALSEGRRDPEYLMTRLECSYA